MDLYENLLQLRVKYAYTQKLDGRRKCGAKRNEDDGKIYTKNPRFTVLGTL